LAATANQQAEIALDQLRYNLFEKRYATYRDVKLLLETLVADADRSDFRASDMARHFRTLDEAGFFFSPATLQWLKDVRGDCQAFLDVNEAWRTWRRDSAERQDLQHKLARHLRDMPERFHDDMSFRQLTRR
jgi:hypothetical protein